MTAAVSRTPPTRVRRENAFNVIEREGRDACQAGLSRHVCKYTGIERRAWLTGYEQAEAERKVKNC